MNSAMRILRSSGITKNCVPSGWWAIPSAYPFGVTATVTSFSPSNCLRRNYHWLHIRYLTSREAYIWVGFETEIIYFEFTIVFIFIVLNNQIFKNVENINVERLYLFVNNQPVLGTNNKKYILTENIASSISKPPASRVSHFEWPLASFWPHSHAWTPTPWAPRTVPPLGCPSRALKIDDRKEYILNTMPR